MNDPWDVRPRSEKGDDTPAFVFCAVGAAITAWERLESAAAELFDLLLASGNRAAFKVYQSSTNTNARREMLKAALPLERATDSENEAIDSFVTALSKFADRRNEIAHGQVLDLGGYGYYLCPSNLRKSKWTKQGAAKYQYVAADINYYAEQFALLREKCDALVSHLKAATKL